MTPRQRQLFKEAYKAGYKAAKKKQLQENALAAAGVAAVRIVGPAIVKQVVKKLALNPKTIKTATQAIKAFEKMLPFIKEVISSNQEGQQNPQQVAEQTKEAFVQQLPQNVQQEIKSNQQTGNWFTKLTKKIFG